jgi:hypothetical protein
MQETAITVFVGITAVAFVVQAAIMAGMYSEIRKASNRMGEKVDDLHLRVTPLISKIDTLIGETQPRIVSLVVDASEVVSLARGQAQKVDRVLTETLDRLRIQLIHADQMMTGALDTVEDAGTTVKRSVLGPVRQATAVIRGVKAGIDVLRNRQRSSDGSGESPDEGLFI